MGNQQTASKHPAPAGAEDGATSGATSLADPLSPTTMWRWETTSKAALDPSEFSPTTKCIKQKMKDPDVMDEN
jgi:hypothetical protein